MNLRFFFREIYHFKKQSLVFVLCVALSLVSIVAVNSFKREVLLSINSDARALHGGDIIAHSHYPFSVKIEKELSALVAEGDVQAVRTWGFYSVVRKKDGLKSLLCSIKAVGKDYPFYGTVELLSGRNLSQVLQPGKVVVGAAFLERLKLEVGDTFFVGSGELEIADVIVQESSRPIDFFNFGPRLLMSAGDLAGTELVKNGGRIQYEILLRLALKKKIDVVLRRLQQNSVAEQERVQTYATAESGIKRFFDNLLFFLSLIAIFTLLLAGIGMQSSLVAIIRQREKTLAIIRSLGATSSFLYNHYLRLVFLLTSLGCFLGITSGLLIEQFFAIRFAGVLSAGFVPAIVVYDIAEGLIIGFLAAGFFTFLPLRAIKEVKPSMIFRKDIPSVKASGNSFVLIALGLLFLAALIVRQLDDVTVGLIFMTGIVLLVALISVVTMGMYFSLKKINPLSLHMRLAVRSLLRPGNATRTIIVTLTSALSVLLVIFLVEDNLRATFIESYPKDAPTLFCLDIQKDQRQEFSTLVGGEEELFPVIRARLTAVNDRPVIRKQEMKKKSDNLAREFNLTYREQLLSDETLVDGSSLFVKDAKGEYPLQVSVLDTVAKMGNMSIGDVLHFNIQGVPMQAEITSIRSRTKSMLYPFFYFVFPEQYLKAAPHTFFSALHVGQSEVAELENRIVNRFPNISTIDVSQSAVVLGNLMAKLNFIVTVFAGFAVLAGVFILVGAVFATQVARTKEVVFYKILGAGSQFVIRVLMLENIILALLSAGSAILIAQVAGWLVCRYLFDIEYSPNIFACLGLLGLTVCCVVGVGLVSSVSVLYKKPVQFLREQG